MVRFDILSDKIDKEVRKWNLIQIQSSFRNKVESDVWRVVGNEELFPLYQKVIEN